jgi:protein SCO1/2
VKEMVSATPMKDMVQFLTVTTDPAADTPEITEVYGEVHGLDAHNWMFLTTRVGQAEDTTRDLAKDYDQRFDPLMTASRCTG